MDIKDIQGNIILSVSISQECERVEELMKSDYIQLSWNSNSRDVLPAGSYIEYKGEKYSLLKPYSPTQKDEMEFTYQPQFQSKIMIWGKTPFFMYTYADNTITNREPDWNLTDNPANFMSVVVDAIKNETGDIWTYSIGESLPASASLSFQSIDIFSALNQIANAFETEWWVDKVNKVIHLSKASHGNAVLLEVGGNVNTPSVTSGKEGYYTRFYAFGSTRNIVQDYKGANVNNLVNKRLTLDPVKYPGGYKDIHDNLSSDEIFSKVLIFDDIYPSSKLKISDVRVRLMWTIDPDTKEKIQIGTDSEGNPVYDQYAIWYFQVPEFAFDNTTYDKDTNPQGMKLPDKNLSVHFQDGPLSGREFELNYHDKGEKVSSADGSPFQIKEGDYEILFVKEGSLVIPMISNLVPADGNEIILFNIRMPEEYISSAYLDLESALDKEMERMSSDLNNYQFSSNPGVFESDNPNLSLGRKVTYKNGTYSYSTRVIKLVTKLDYDIEQTITVGNEQIKGNTQEIKEEVASANKDINLLAILNSTTNSLTQAYNRTQQLMLEGFAAIKDMWRFDPNNADTIYSKYNVYSEKALSSMGLALGSGGSGEGGATALYQLNDVAKNASETGVLGAGPGKVLTYGTDGKWYAADAIGLDETALGKYLTDNNYAKKSDIPSLSGYATESWVLGKNYITSSALSGYATASSLKVVSDKLNDFLTGTDTDGIINKWKELEAFLAGQTQTSTLAELLAVKADKATTLSGYGITDAYTKSEINSKLSGYVTTTALNTALAKKVDVAFLGKVFGFIGEDNSEVAINDMEAVITSIKAKFGLWTDEYLSSKGLNPNAGSGSGEGATALYQLNDVAQNANGTGVLGAETGKVLTYGSDGKWYAAKAGMDEDALSNYLTVNNYAKKSDIPSLDGYATITSVNSALDNKVDKVSGMGLSQNNFTDALLQKLNGIAEGANKYILPVAKAAVLGGVMIGSTLNASEAGVLNLPEVMTAGTYAKVTTDIYGRVTSGSSLSAGDIPALGISKITGLQDALDKKVSKSDFATEFDKAMQRWFVRDTANKGLHPADYNSEAVGIYSDSYVSSKGVNTGTGGGTGGASSLGELNNVGSWADEIPTVDRIMVQRKGATHWESLNLSDIGLNESQLSNYLTTNNYAKKSDIPSLAGYATENWVLGKGYITSAALTGYATQSWVNTQLGSYATSSALQTVSDKLDDFLTGADTDDVINKWKELEDFLTGFKETDTLADALSLKADKTISISAGTGLSGGGNLTANRTISLKVATTEALGGIKVGSRLSIDANGVLSATYTYMLPTASATVLGGVKVGTTLAISSGVLNLKAVGTAGTYFKVTTDAYGRVTSGSNPTTLSGFGITDGFNTVAYSGSGNAITSATFSGHTLTLVKGTTFLTKATFDDLFEKVNIGTTSAPVYAIKAKYGLYTDQFLSSMGLNTGTGGGSGSDYDRLDAWTDYDASKAGWVLSAGLGNDLNTRMTNLEGGAAVTVTPSGTGSVVTGVTKSGTVITVTKGNLAFGSLTGKPTTLSGYGITDAVTLTTPQEISGQKTFSNSIRLSNKDIQRVNAATGTNATGSWWRTANYATTIAGVGCLTIDNANPRLFMGWSEAPWELANSLTVSSTSLTYKNNAILHAGNYNTYAPTKTGTGASGTWGISITGNAATATKLGTATVGSTSKGIYLNAGVPTAMSATVGDSTIPVYMNAGTITASTWGFTGTTGNRVRKSGYVYSATASLSSYWGKLASMTFNGTTERDITLYVHSGAYGYYGIVAIRTRWESTTAFYVSCKIISGNLLADRFRLYYDASKTNGNVELWANVATQWGTLGAYVLSCTARTSLENGDVTLHTNSFSTAQTLPTTPYVSPTYITLYNNANTATQLQTSRTIWGQSFNGTANVSGAMTGVTSITASGLISTTAENPGFLVKSGSTNKSCVGWLTNVGAYLYSYECSKYLGINSGGYPTFGGGGSTYMMPHRKLLFSKNDYEYWVVLLWDITTTATHRVTGKLFTETGGGSRYQAADINLWRSQWNTTTGADMFNMLNTYGQGTPWNLVTCTYGGKTYYALQHTNTQATNAYLLGIWSNTAFTAIKYYTVAHGDVAAVVNNSDINGSIKDVSTSVLSANGAAYALVTSNVASATKLQTARTIFGKSFDGSANVAGQAFVYGNYTATASNRYSNGGIQVRENGLVGSAQTDDGYAPAIGFHWQSKIAASLIMSSAGEFKFLKQNFTDYAPIYAGHITAQGSYLRSVNNGNTVQIGSQNTTYAHFTSSKPFWFGNGMEINGYCYPYTNNSFTLGNASKRWSGIYGTVGDFSSYIQIGSIRLTYDSANNAIKVSKSDGTAAGLYAMGFLSSMGLATGTGSGGGSDYDRLDSWSDYTADKAGYVLSAKLGNDLNTQLTSVAANYVTTNTAQTITAQKTWTTSQRMGKTSIHRVNDASGANATGGHWYTNNYAAVQFGIGVYTEANANPRAYIGWTATPWQVSTNLTVSSTQLTYKSNNILHAANYNDYAPSKTGTGASGTWGISITGNAATVGGFAASKFMQNFASSSTDLNDMVTSGVYRTTNTNANLPSGTYYYSQVLVLRGGGDTIGQLAMSYSQSGRMAVRSGNPTQVGSTGTWGAWNTVAFTTDNVASATKLQTARTIWGQSFNGTANVSGNLTSVGHIQFSANASYNIGTTSNNASAVYARTLQSNSTLYLASTAASILFKVGDTEAARISGSNYFLGLGVTAPTQRLDVSGNVKATGYFYSGGWFENNVANKGLYNSVGDARWYWNGTGWYADKAIISSSTIQGTQLKSTVATGTAPLTVASTTMVTNLNAQMVGGIGASNIPLEYDASYTPTGTAARWIRIAYFDYTSAIGSYSGTFAISNSFNNDTNRGFIFNVTTSHGTQAPVITQVGGDNGVFTSVRIVKDTTTTYPTAAKVYLEVYYNSTSAGNAVYVSYRPENRSRNKWTLYTTYTAGSIPTGYTAIATLTTTIGMATTGGLRVQQSVSILGNTNHNSRLSINNLGYIYPYSTSTRSAGMYGVYDSAKIGHIWSMGTTYKISDDGANFGNLYGFAYKHTNNATGGNMATGHQAVWCENGTPRVAIGTNLWVANAATVGGTLSANTITIKNTEAKSHLTFSRGNFNYITAPASGIIGFVVNGQGVSDANSDLVIADGVIRPGANNATTNGSASFRWSNTYTQLLNVAGTATIQAVAVAGASSFSSTVTIASTLNVNGVLNANNTTDATSTTAAGAVFDGGVGIAKQLRVGGNVTLGNALYLPYSGSSWLTLGTRTNIMQGAISQTESSAHGLYRVKSYGGHTVTFGGLGNVVGFYGIYKATIDAGTNRTDWSTIWDTTTGKLTHNKAMEVYGVLDAASTVNANSTTDSTSTTTGSIVCDGGVGIAKQLRVGGATTLSSTLSVAGIASFTNATDATSTTAAGVKVTGGLGVAKQLRVGGLLNLHKSGEAMNLVSGASDQKISKTVSSTFYSGINFYGTTGSNLGHSDIQMNIYSYGALQIHSQGSGKILLVGEVHNNVGMYSDGYMSSKGLNDTSDMRLKNKVRDIFLSVKDIANAPAFEYTWKDGTPGVMAGSSAQYWEKVLPPSVKKNKDGYLSLFSGHTALVAAISVAREVETLQQRVARLEKENKEKDKTIEDLNQKYITLKNMYYGKIDSAC